MAAGELTGATPTELANMREEFRGTPVHEGGVPFETAYCLSTIGKQPDEYDGPTRYCRNRAKKYEDNDGNEQYAPCCRFHGGRSNSDATNENLDKLANLSHGYYAMQEHLLEDLGDEERQAYDKIMDKGAEKGITPEDDFFAWESLQALALNIVTDRRLRMLLNREGVTTVANEFGPDGALLDQRDEEHHLLDISLKQRRMIQSLKDDLALTRKHQDEMDAIEEGATISFLGEGMAEAIKDEEKEYDPDEWENSA